MPRCRVASLLIVVLVAALAGAVAVAAAPQAMSVVLERARIRRLGGTYLGDDGVVLQRAAWDCGPAALANLLALRGDGTGLDALTQLSGASPRGTRLQDLARAATQLGHPARAHRLPVWRYRADSLDPRLPLVAWVDRRHFVTIAARAAGDAFLVIDPQLGRYLLPFGAIRARWSGEALVLE